MRPVLESARLLLWGILKRSYLLLPSLLLDPFDLYERLFNKPVNIPVLFFYLALVGGVAIAAVLTYHELLERHEDLRKEHEALQGKRRHQDWFGRTLLHGQNLTLALAAFHEWKLPVPGEFEVWSKWNSEIEDYLSRQFGTGYLARWRMKTDLLPPHPTKVPLAKAIEQRLEVLEEFIEELAGIRGSA
jgi:hypothetical protein